MGQLFANWTGLDCVISAVLLLSALFGLVRGFAKEVVALLSWVAAIYLALHFSSDVSQLLQSAIPNATTRNIAAIAIIVVVVVIAGFLIGKLIRSLLSLTGFGFFDRLLGAVFGVARGLLFVTVALVIIQATTYKDATWMKQSQLAPHYAAAVAYISAQLPKELRSASIAVNYLVALNVPRAGN